MTNPTSNFGWQMPEPTDLVTNLPADFEVFGQAVDSDFVDLLGGTTGQVLSKTSNTDLDFTWTSANPGDITGVTAGTGISGGGTSGTVTVTNDMATTITAAGDIVVGTGSGTYDNLPIGTTNQILTADTTVSPYKVKWATPAGGSSDYKLINTTSFVAVASQSVDSVFTSTYENYKIIINIFPTSTADTCTFRLRASGTDTTVNYNSGRLGFNGSVTFNGLNVTGTDDWYIGYDASSTTSCADMTLFRPQIASPTSFISIGNTGSMTFQTTGGSQSDSTQFDGFKIAIITGTFTGNVSVYGLAK